MNGGETATVPSHLPEDRWLSIPSELREVPRWVLWKYTTTDDCKRTKIPLTATGAPASSTGPDTWCTFDRAIELRQYFGDGIGFAFNGDGVMGVDFDNIRDPGTEEIDPDAWSDITLLNSYSEISPGGTGVHVLCRGTLPNGKTGCNRKEIGREMYSTGRFFTVTGNWLPGTPKTVNESQEAITTLYNQWVPPPPPPRPAPCSVSPAINDDEVVRLATNARNGAKFESLMRGDTSGHDSPSEADLALCSHLAFYTQDRSQILRIVQCSELWDEKWERLDYQERTIGKALANVREVYQGPRMRLPPAKNLPVPTVEDRQKAVDEQCKVYPHTDLGNCARFVSRYNMDVMYCYPWGSWFVWNGALWKKDEEGIVVSLAKEAARRIGMEAVLIEDDTRRSKLFEWAGRSQARARIDAMIDLSKPDVAILPNLLDGDKNLLNCSNGTLELDTLTFREHRRDDCCTMVTGVDYNLAATCPQWESFLQTIFQDDNGQVKEDLIKFVQRALGYSITAHIGERVLFFCHGGGANGKSTLLNCVAAVLGDYARQTKSETFLIQRNEGVRNDLAALNGRRMVLATEAPRGKRLDESLVKALSGGDKITARFLFKEYFEFIPTFKIWWGFNHRPAVADQSNSIWDRIRLIPFTVTIPPDKRDVNLPEKLAAEGSGILNWIIAGLREYRRIGLSEPEEVKIATNDYREEQDRLADFIAEKCIEDPKAWTSTHDLYVAYQWWCNENREEALSLRRFGFEMGERYIRHRDTTTGKKGYRGIRLNVNPTLQTTVGSENRTISNLKDPNAQSSSDCSHEGLSAFPNHGSTRFENSKDGQSQNDTTVSTGTGETEENVAKSVNNESDREGKTNPTTGQLPDGENRGELSPVPVSGEGVPTLIHPLGKVTTSLRTCGYDGPSGPVPSATTFQEVPHNREVKCLTCGKNSHTRSATESRDRTGRLIHKSVRTVRMVQSGSCVLCEACRNTLRFEQMNKGVGK